MNDEGQEGDAETVAEEDRSSVTKLISIVVPTYNEEDNVERLYEEVARVFDGLDGYEFEIIFCDNHSEDDTFPRVQKLAQRDGRIRGVRYARNFGFNRSVLTGYRLASGDAAVQLDADLQDPPEMIPVLIEQWERGHDCVVGIRKNRQEAVPLQLARKVFYRLLRRVSDDNIVNDAGDFRLIDHTIISHLRYINDAEPYTRALTSLMAKTQIGVPYSRNVRQAGESKYPLRRLFGLAVEGMIAHSVAPLRFASLVGFIIAGACTVAAFLFIALKLFGVSEGPRGFTTTALLILFGVGLNAIFLGIIGEYLGRIYNQLRRRPTTVLEDSVNFEAYEVPMHELEPWRRWMPVQAPPKRPEE